MLLLFASALAQCPFHGMKKHNNPGIMPGENSRISGRAAPEGYLDALDKIDWDQLKKDLVEVMTTSQPFFPADYGHYGPLMIRLAWHNAGSYRTSDGRGGADGGRQRFDPERSWDDNTNLDKARKILEPIKAKYGLGLSWGDLLVFAGNVAIEDMEPGVEVPFCAGRIDDSDGFWSERLGPTHDQETNEPCAMNGACRTPFGANQVGLIYVNPEGFLGEPDPVKSAVQIRSTFARMGMNDYETVALAAGGHSFGKVHGPCTTGPGPNPKEAPLNSWPGTCGTTGEPDFGVGVNTFTSGFEGPWTSTPTAFDVEYLANLLDFEWEKHIGPGGHYQWRVVGSDKKRVGPYATFANGTGIQNVMMLTSDLALVYDDIYKKIVKEFRDDFDLFETAWIDAWYKLMSRDMGPVSRCLGPKVAMPARPFQGPLPDPPATMADMDQVRLVIETAIKTKQFLFDKKLGMNMVISDLVRLAYRCAATFRVTDYAGGCNGARIRSETQLSWPVNAGLDKVLAVLSPVKSYFGDGLSWADLIVYAGTIALEMAGAPAMEFCPGRVDVDLDDVDEISPNLSLMNMEPVVTGEFSATIDDLEQWTLLLGMSKEEMTALLGGVALGKIPFALGGGQRTDDTQMLSNQYYTNLIGNQWGNDGRVYFAKTANVFSGLTIRVMTRTDILLISSAEFRSVVNDFAGDQSKFLQTLATAWTKLMNADRFDGPLGNVCDKSGSGKKKGKGKASGTGSADIPTQDPTNVFTPHPRVARTNSFMDWFSRW